MKIENRYVMNDSDITDMAINQNITDDEASIILKNRMIEQFQTSYADIAKANIDIWANNGVKFYHQIAFMFSLDQMIEITQTLDEITMTDEQKEKISKLLMH